MIKLHAGAQISDYELERGIAKEYMEKRVQEQIARGFADLLLKEKDFQKNIVKRDKQHDFFSHQRTVFETTMWLLTPEEAQEYNMLKEFRAQLKHFTR